MNILISCEYSGIVRDAFIKKGHNAVSCDLLPTEQPGPHIQGNVLDAINDGWDMMIAFPPCTHLCVSGARHFQKKKADGRQQQGIDFFMSMINAPIEKISIENPIGIMSNIYKKPSQIIHPYYFGDNVRKSTCLWLKNLPHLMYHLEDNLFSKKTSVQPEIIEFKKRTGDKKVTFSKWEYDCACISNRAEKAKARSKTFQGIADAMAEQWGE